MWSEMRIVVITLVVWRRMHTYSPLKGRAVLSAAFFLNYQDCEKFHGLLAVFDASSVAQSTELTREARQRAMDVDAAEAARREHLFLVRPVIEPDPSEPSEMVGNIFKAVNRDGADGADLLQINQKEVEEEVPCTIEEKAGRESVSCLQDSNSRSSGCPKAQPQLQVVLTIPLSAMTIRGMHDFYAPFDASAQDPSVFQAEMQLWIPFVTLLSLLTVCKSRIGSIASIFLELMN